MSAVRRIWRWLDDNLLAVLAGFLLVFIPLYPKWPLLDVIPGYIVRVRLEDVFVALTFLVFLVQLGRKKVQFEVSLVFVGLFLYLLFGLLSVIAAVFIVETVPNEWLHISKSVFHWLRRIEYFSLFFVVFGSIKSLRQVKWLVVLLFATLLLVSLYGYGQKYLYFPAFSTMNREFSKGWWLYLTEHARVLSTFGGHYDLAGYLVILLTLCWSFLFGLSRKIPKLLVGVVLVGGFWLLILTASRISFLSYLVGLTVVIFLWTFQKGLSWGLTRWAVATFLSVLLMLSFGDLSDRFLRLARVADRISGIRNVLLKPAAKPPANATLLENNLAAVALRSDVPPTPRRPGDVYFDVPLFVPSGEGLVEKRRTYSEYALLFDLSTGIRLDATWPRAVAGFVRSPILGSGYATLTKTSKYEFTEAESTDNDYLRALGETGVLGFAAFFGTIVVMAVVAFRSLGGIKDRTVYALISGFVAVVFGLLVNALLIDIFEASKVAYTFWGVAGLVMGTLYLQRERIKKDWEPMRITFDARGFAMKIQRLVRGDGWWLFLILVLGFALRTYKLDAPVADWHSWRQADTSAVTRQFVKTETINWLYPTYDDLSSVPSGKPNPKGYRFVEFPLYNAAATVTKKVVPELSVEEAGRVTTALASCLTALFLFLLARRYLSARVGFLAALTYALLPYSIYYGRVILPDPLMVAVSLGAVWFWSQFLTLGRGRYFLAGLVLASLALLVKPFAVFLLAPIGYMWLVNFGFDKKKWLLFVGCCLLVVVPLALWRLWISQFPEGVPAFDWLFNGDQIRFKGAFWFWLFADRVGRLILGHWGLVLLGFGILTKIDGKFRHFALVLLASSVIYLFVFATGNVRHDYYQILVVPGLVLFVALGLDYLFFGVRSVMARLLAIVSFLFMLAFGWYHVRDYYNTNHPEIVEAGGKVRDLTAEHEKALVVAPYDGDTAFLYQTERSGWPIMQGSIEEMVAMGADYYVSVRFDELTRGLVRDSYPGWLAVKEGEARKYKLLVLTDKYVIIQLTPDYLLPGN